MQLGALFVRRGGDDGEPANSFARRLAPGFPQPGHAHQPAIGQCDRVRLLARRGLLPLEKVIEVMAGPCKARNLVIFSRARAVEPLDNALIVDPTVGNVGNATWIEPVDYSELTFFPRASMWILV
jgi:hypothetical protein